MVMVEVVAPVVVVPTQLEGLIEVDMVEVLVIEKGGAHGGCIPLMHIITSNLKAYIQGFHPS